MYCNFYGLKERPFNVTSDPAFFFASRQHEEALSHLIYGVTQRKGIIVITGEIGTGKTTLCRLFLSQLEESRQKTKTAFILNPHFSDIQLIEAIVKDFGINTKNDCRTSFFRELNQFLLREAQNGNNSILIIDESQNLQPNQLEQIRLLSNLETEKDKLIQIILVGQPELNRKLDLYELRQLQQRIMVRYNITSLDGDELKKYIYHRLDVAGSKKIKFSEEAIEGITEFSGGTPRLINIICDRALLAGFVAETSLIDTRIINRCRQELGSYTLQNQETS
ncbi:MAG: AAA family ATPase [Candidatus Omnitrophica bacterium]|nr:AAA family ATPase [Candidatus Omnitrophota bacterium]